MADAPFVAIDEALDAPPYAQIAAQVRAAIVRGDLDGGALLPTVRQLAGDLGVAPNTVARAYAELQDEGWLVGEGRRGTRVAQRSPQAQARERETALRERVASFLRTLAGDGYADAEIRRALDAARRG